jgi:DNA primase
MQFTGKTRERDEPVFLPRDFVLLEEVEDDDDWFGVAKRYARKRGITDEQIKRHRIGASLRDWKFGQRIIFPVYDEQETLLGYTGRDWTGKKDPKYLLTRGTKGIFNARADLYPDTCVILSEGVTKSLAIERALKNRFCSAATLGNQFTDEQLPYIKVFREVIIFPDPDRRGLQGYLGVAANLSTQFEKVSVVWPWPEKQADDMTEGEIRQYLKKRKRYSGLLDMQMRLEVR